MIEPLKHLGASAIGKLGGRANALKNGSAWMSKIARKGGLKAKRNGLDYSRIGKMGVEARRRKKLENEERRVSKDSEACGRCSHFEPFFLQVGSFDGVCKLDSERGRREKSVSVACDCFKARPKAKGRK